MRKNLKIIHIKLYKLDKTLKILIKIYIQTGIVETEVLLKILI